MARLPGTLILLYQTCTFKTQICQIAGSFVRQVDRVLDVRQGDLCWVTGTVYMEMPLKPNILDDISKDVRLIRASGLGLPLKAHMVEAHRFFSIGFLHLHPARNIFRPQG